MQRTHIYLPEEIKREIDHIAKIQGKTKAEITRKVMEEGLKVMKPQKSQSAESLLHFSKGASKFTGNAPTDLSLNHDYYIWGGQKKQEVDK